MILFFYITPVETFEFLGSYASKCIGQKLIDNIGEMRARIFLIRNAVLLSKEEMPLLGIILNTQYQHEILIWPHEILQNVKNS